VLGVKHEFQFQVAFYGGIGAPAGGVGGGEGGQHAHKLMVGLGRCNGMIVTVRRYLHSMTMMAGI
jgi:hypothetical protein